MFQAAGKQRPLWMNGEAKWMEFRGKDRRLSLEMVLLPLKVHQNSVFYDSLIVNTSCLVLPLHVLSVIS